MRRSLALLLALLLLPLAPARAADEMSGIGDLTGDERIVHVLNRLGYGPRPGDVARVRETGLFRYLVLQLHPERIPDDECEKRLEALPSLRMSATEAAETYARPSPEDRKALADATRRLAELRRKDDSDKAEMMKLVREVRKLRRKNDRNLPLRELMRAKVIRAVHSERQLEQVMADFWFNHFNVFGRKGPVTVVLPEFEERVIRPHALGTFRDLLVAVAKHPAMLYYLDNWRSQAAADAPVLDRRRRIGERRGGARGLNENYARELLELHTVGVEGGYDQADVVEVARCFTGWTISNGRGKKGEIGFRFEPRWHDAGPKEVMGLRIGRGGGVEDGLAVLDFLATHPNTALFLSEKLCRRFVSDDPPRALVERCAGTFLESGGDIRLVLYRIFTSPEFFSADAARAKLKNPHTYAISAMRALGVETDAPRRLLRTIGVLGEPLYYCEPPTGYSDLAEKWGGSNAILSRVNFATALAFGRVRGAKPDFGAVLGDVPVDDPHVLADRIVTRCVGRPLSPEAARAIDGVIERAKRMAKGPRRRTTRDEAAGLLCALVLGSPDFQMR